LQAYNSHNGKICLIMLKKLINIFKSPSVKADYNRPQANRLIEGGWWANKPWWPNHIKPIEKEVTVQEWRTIVSSCNRLYWNFGPVAGAIDDKATYAIGKAWSPKFEGEDKEWGKIAAEWLENQWYNVAYVNGITFQDGLYLDSICVDRDGDVGTILTETDNGYPQLQQIPWFAISSRTGEQVLTEGPYKGLNQYNGVIYNEFKRPVAYILLGNVPENDRYISARSMELVLDPRTPGQMRGFPAFTSAVLDLRDLMTTQGYIKQAAMLASSIGLIETNELGMIDPGDPAIALNDGPSYASGGGLYSEEIVGGTVRYFRANSGAKIEQLASNVPSDQTNSLMERLVRNAMLSAGMPPEFYWKPEGTGANVRVIVQKVNKTIADRQSLLHRSAKRRVSFAVAKAIKLGLIPKYTGKDSGGMLKWNFSMPEKLTPDAGHASNDAREAYKLGLKTMTEILGESGRTLEKHLDEREAEELAIRERMQRSGLPESAFRVLLNTGNPPDLTQQPVDENAI
jgi:hypothetical protein